MLSFLVHSLLAAGFLLLLLLLLSCFVVFFVVVFLTRGPEVNYIHSVFNIECALDYVISSCINMHATNKDIRFDSIYYSYKNSI